MRIALGIQYNGTEYSGWQEQPGKKTIQTEIENALANINGNKPTLFCAGRTDAGVHALNQVAHFDTYCSRPLSAWVRGTNCYLSPDIRIQWAKMVDENFHARHSAISRTYRYLICNQAILPPFLYKRALHITYQLDWLAMKEASQCLIGENDFSAFRGKDCQAKTPFREVKKINVFMDAHFLMTNMIVIEITANAFLHHMVRNIVGTLLEIGRGRRDKVWLEKVLASKSRKEAGATACASGLYFYQVQYPENLLEL